MNGWTLIALGVGLGVGWIIGFIEGKRFQKQLSEETG